MPWWKWDLACEHLNALNGHAQEEGDEMGVPQPAPASESVDLFAPDAAERLGLTLVKGTG